MKKSIYTQKIENKLINYARTAKLSSINPETYIIGQSQSCLKFLKLTNPDMRKNVDHQSTFQEIIQLWKESDYYEGLHISLYWLEKQSPDFLIKNQKQILKMSSRIDNWSHSDSLCSLLAKVYEIDSSYLQLQFEKMNTHKNPWYRRISMISLFYYSRSREKQPAYSLAEKFVFKNISDPHYYVQKAIGWTLREMYNAYPEKTLRFVKKNIHKITSVAWVAANEKWPVSVKAEFTKSRKHKKSL